MTDTTPIHLFLDDERPGSPDLTVCRTADEAISWLKTGRVDTITFDYNLNGPKTGYDVALYIEQAVSAGEIKTPSWHIHCAPPIWARKINMAMNKAIRHEQGRQIKTA